MDEGQQSHQTDNQCLDFLGIPDSCHLGKRVFKKLFLENADLGSTDKKAIRDDVESVTWVYKLSPETIAIPGYEDDDREYHEIAVLQIDTKTQKRTRRIAEIIHRAIPYPLVLVFRHLGDSDAKDCLFSLAHKRFSQSEKGAIVADEFHDSPWFDLCDPTDVQSSFLASLKMAELPHSDLFVFYSAMVDRMIALDCARLSGQFTVGTKENQVDRLQTMRECRRIETQITELRAEIKQEDQFNRRVELNVKIKDLENELNSQTSLL